MKMAKKDYPEIEAFLTQQDSFTKACITFWGKDSAGNTVCTELTLDITYALSKKGKLKKSVVNQFPTEFDKYQVTLIGECWQWSKMFLAGEDK